MASAANDNLKRVKTLKYSMFLGYTTIIILVTILISVMAMNKTDDALKSKVSSMTSSLNTQMKMNIDSYLSRMETTGTLIFAEEKVYLYDAAAENADGYEALSTEKAISDKLFDLCIMENFVDFGIVYKNNHIVGKVSNGTVELFGDRLYEDLTSFINRQRTHDGWSTGYNGNYKRIYYTKQVNDNAVLVISFYTTELENVLEHPGGMGDVTITVTDDNYSIIYSSEDEEIGKTLPDTILSRIENQNFSAVIDNEYLVTMNNCGDNWKVICSVPTEIILKEKNEVQVYIIIVGAVAAVIATILSIFLSLKISDPVDNIVTVLNKKAYIDQLTGVMNKRSFEERTENALANAENDKKYALIILDVDNFKGVNDTLGHAYGDQVLSNIGVILRSIFRSEDFLGRLGGDEFCVCLDISSEEKGSCRTLTEKKCRQLCDAFHSNYTGDDNSYKISVSIGAAFYPTHGKTFSELYKCADKALYKSKRTGKDTYTIYSEEMQ